MQRGRLPPAIRAASSARLSSPPESGRSQYRGRVEPGAGREDGVAPALEMDLVRERRRVSVERLRHTPRRPCPAVEREDGCRRQLCSRVSQPSSGPRVPLEASHGHGGGVEAEVAHEGDQRPLGRRGQEDAVVKTYQIALEHRLSLTSSRRPDPNGRRRRSRPAAGPGGAPTTAPPTSPPRHTAPGVRGGQAWVDDGDDETRLLEDAAGHAERCGRATGGRRGAEVVGRERQLRLRAGRRR